MQRATSHRSKPGDNWQELLDILSSTTFFLVARCGPTVFNVRDEDGKIFKVTISNPHTCSCRIDSRCNLCIHQVFVLLKVLKISQGHPLSYQTSLTDSEITQVLSGVCGSSAALSRVISITRRHSQSSKKADEVNGAGDGFVHRQELDEDSCIQCPICQDDMNRDQALTWCRRGCGNNIHAKCMQNYSQYKISNKESAGCPLCRVDWALDLLKGDCRGLSSLKHTCLPVYCAGCTFPQRAKFNRCLECSQAAFLNFKKPVDFCTRCYPSIGKEHSNHHFLISDASASDLDEILWLPVTNPRAAPQLMDIGVLTALQQRELSVEDYDTLLDLDKNVPDLPTQLILSLLDNIQDETEQQSCWCSGKNKATETDNIQILPCKHTCHESCLRKIILEAISSGSNGLTSLKCNHPECQSKIFSSLIRRRKKKTLDVPSNNDSSTKDTSAISTVATAESMVGYMGLGIRGVASASLTIGKGPLRIGALHRGVGSLGEQQGSGSTTARTPPLGIEGLSLSVAATPRGSREGATSVRESNSATRENRESKHVKNRRVRSTERSIDATHLPVGDNAEDLELANQLIFISASGITGLSSSSSASSLIGDVELQQQQRLGAREPPGQSVGRIIRPPRPRPLPSELGDISGIGLGIGAHGGGLNGVAIGTRSAGTRKIEVLLSASAPLSPNALSNSVIGDETESDKALTGRRIEVSRSAGSLREQRDMFGVNSVLPLPVAIGVNVRPLTGLQTSQSSTTIGNNKSPRGRIGRQNAVTTASAECGGDLVPSKVGRRVRAAVGNTLRDAVISEGHSSLTPPSEIGASLSLLLNINGQQQQQQQSGVISSTAQQPLPLRGSALIRRGRPSPYRPSIEVVQSTTHP